MVCLTSRGVGRMKFKVGDKVRVKKELISGEDYGGLPLVNRMKERRGKVVTIHEINPRVMAYEIAEDGGKAYWTDEMLEPISDPLADKILERNNKSYSEKLKELTEPLDLIEQHKRICERL